MYQLYATCPQGMEGLLAGELKTLGIADARPTRGGVEVSTTQLADAYRICLWSQLCNRLLLRLARFRTDTPEAVYAAVAALDWSEHMAADGSLLVEAKLRDSKLGNAHFVALRVKDAIVDQFRERQGVRPSVDLRAPHLRLNLFVHKQQAELALDLSGGGLRRALGEDAHWRGGLGAAALCWATSTPGTTPILVLGAGDADLLHAAAMLAAHVAPGLLLPGFGFEHWLGHVPALWARLRAEAQAARRDHAEPVVQVWEEDRQRLAAARRTAREAGLEDQMIWQTGPWERQSVPQPAGVVLVPPPDAVQAPLRGALTRKIEHLLRKRLADWDIVQIALEEEREDQARWSLKPRRALEIRRGKRQFRLLQYRLRDAAGRAESRDAAGAGAERPQADAPPPDAPPAPLMELEGESAQMLVNRLRKNLKHLGKWARRNAVSCYRLYDADLPEYAAAVDLYQSEQLWAVIQEYAAPATLDAERVARHREALRAAVAEVLDLGPQHIVLKTRQRQRGKAQYERQAARGEFHVVVEGGVKLWVNFTDYLDTGLFLDHRPLRLELGRLAAGRQVLNLFAYTGAATAHMVAGGARSSTTVDLSRTYLDWAQRNLVLNDLDGPAHRFIQADCLSWLDAQASDPASKRYGLIYMDPPTFSSSKRMEGVLDVQRDHVRMIRAAAALLRPGGELYFSNNFRKFQLDRAALAELCIEDISSWSIAEDFRRNPRIHQCFRITRAEGAATAAAGG